MSIPISMGIVGLGAMGSEMLRVATEHPDFHVALCAEIQPDNLNRAQRRYPTTRFTSSPSDVIDSKEIEAVYIATPPSFHANYAIKAMESGKAVFCEKPLAISISDGEAMLEVAKRTDAISVLNFALSDRRAVLEIERSLKADEAGDICAIDIRLAFPRWPRDFQSGAAWLGDRQQGGFMREVFSHFAYLTDRLIGPLKPMFTQLGYGQGSIDSSETSAFGLLHGGRIPVRVVGQTTAAVPEMYDWYLYGTRRSYCLRDWGDLFISDGKSWTNIMLDGERGSEMTRLTKFSKQIRGEKHDNQLPDFSVGLRVLQLVEAFHAADSQ